MSTTYEHVDIYAYVGQDPAQKGTFAYPHTEYNIPYQLGGLLYEYNALRSHVDILDTKLTFLINQYNTYMQNNCSTTNITFPILQDYFDPIQTADWSAGNWNYTGIINDVNDGNTMRTDSTSWNQLISTIQNKSIQPTMKSETAANLFIKEYASTVNAKYNWHFGNIYTGLRAFMNHYTATQPTRDSYQQWIARKHDLDVIMPFDDILVATD